MNYALAVNGVVVENVEANYASNVVVLSGLSLEVGDEIQLRISGLRDSADKALRGGTIGLVAR